MFLETREEPISREINQKETGKKSVIYWLFSEKTYSFSRQRVHTVTAVAPTWTGQVLRLSANQRWHLNVRCPHL